MQSYNYHFVGEQDYENQILNFEYSILKKPWAIPFSSCAKRVIITCVE